MSTHQHASLDSGLLLTSLGSGTIHIWKWKTGRLLKTFDLPISDCSCIIPYRDEIIAMAGARVEIWRPACVSGLDTNRIPDKATLFGSYLESHWEEFPSL
jgi:WD40 repeat protein